MKLDPRVTVINSRLEHINLSVFLCLVRGEKMALIDSGTSFSPQQNILPVLKESGLGLGDVAYVLNTHAHNDHIGGDAEMSRAGAKIMIHGLEARQVETPQVFLKEWFSPMITGIMGRQYIEEEWEKYSSFSGGEAKVDRKLKDNDVIDLGKGVSLKAVHLPGHSDGSLGFYWESEGILFGGDAFPCLMDRDGALPNIVDLEAFKKSVKHVLGMPLKLSILSHEHWGITSEPAFMRDAATTKKFLEECLAVAETMQEAIASAATQAAGRPFQAIYNEIVKKLPEAWGFGPYEKVPIIVMSGQVIYFELKRLGAID